jgi:YidC/Oxa1 family membrane protein insertase
LNAITDLWNTFLVHPIMNALIALADLTGSAGLAIIVFTIIVRTLVLPLGIKQARSQRAMFALQPQIKELQRKYPNDRQKFAVEQMKLYKEAGVHPLAGCLPMVIQMPIWFALYSALNNLSSAQQDASAFQAPFLWIPSLAHPSMPDFSNPVTYPLVILPVLTAVTQWVVQKMSTMPPSDPQQAQMNRMMEFMPLMFLYFSFQVASGLVLYWVVSNLYSIVQQRFTVGWGTLPILGRTQLQGTESTATAAGEPRAGSPTGSPARRGGSNSTGRKKKGK